MEQNNNSKECPFFSIGELARLSGVPVDTLRNWERRFAWPMPVRLDSKHRRYSAEIVPRLRLIHRALDLGFKPSFALTASMDELENSVRQMQGTKPACDFEFDREIQNWTELILRWDASGFETALRISWARFGAKTFILKLLVPFLKNAKICSSHQRESSVEVHFACERLSTFLAEQWQPISNRSNGQRVIAANMEGDYFPIGVHMAAVFLALRRFHVVSLGYDAAVQDVLIASEKSDAIAVVLCQSSNRRSENRNTFLKSLRAQSPSSVSIAVVSDDLFEPVSGVRSIPSFDELDDFGARLYEVYTEIT
jgi:DNA-binding transcriptional MerR regulator